MLQIGAAIFLRRRIAAPGGETIYKPTSYTFKCPNLTSNNHLASIVTRTKFKEPE